MRDDLSGLPLLAWKPACTIIAFPLSKRRSKVQDVASKLATKRTDVHVDQYRSQVSAALQRKLSGINIPMPEQHRQLSAFWTAVDLEVARLSHHSNRGNNPRGAA